jgi:hypothetical protein
LWLRVSPGIEGYTVPTTFSNCYQNIPTSVTNYSDIPANWR